MLDPSLIIIIPALSGIDSSMQLQIKSVMGIVYIFLSSLTLTSCTSTFLKYHTYSSPYIILFVYWFRFKLFITYYNISWLFWFCFCCFVLFCFIVVVLVCGRHWRTAYSWCGPPVEIFLKNQTVIYYHYDWTVYLLV